MEIEIKVTKKLKKLRLIDYSLRDAKGNFLKSSTEMRNKPFINQLARIYELYERNHKKFWNELKKQIPEEHISKKMSYDYEKEVVIIESDLID